MPTELERMAILETEVQQIKEAFAEFKRSVAKASNSNRAWILFLLAQAIQTGILWATLKR